MRQIRCSECLSKLQWSLKSNNTGVVYIAVEPHFCTEPDVDFLNQPQEVEQKVQRTKVEKPTTSTAPSTVIDLIRRKGEDEK